ncbi:MAG: cobalamin-dependent protein [Actinomycetota bacterium]
MLSHETPAATSAVAPVDSTHPLRVLVTKIGFDGHDRGSRLVAAFLRDAGHEVVYTPPWQEISAVVTLAMQEDVDVIGVSSLATDHLIVPELMAALSDAGLGHVQVVVGGIVPDHEAPALTEAGVARIFGPGSSREDIVDGVEAIGRIAQEHKRARGGFES